MADNKEKPYNVICSAFKILEVNCGSLRSIDQSHGERRPSYHGAMSVFRSFAHSTVPQAPVRPPLRTGTLNRLSANEE
jgi:hypothetical protein